MNVLAGLDSKIGLDKKVFKPYYDALGLEYTNELSVANWKVRVNLFLNIKDIITNNIAGAFEKFKSWIMEQVYTSLAGLIEMVGKALSIIPRI